MLTIHTELIKYCADNIHSNKLSGVCLFLSSFSNIIVVSTNVNVVMIN